MNGLPIEDGNENSTLVKHVVAKGDVGGERGERLDITDMDRVVQLADQVTERLGRFMFQSGEGSSGMNFLSAMSGMNPLNLKLDKDRILRVFLHIRDIFFSLIFGFKRDIRG